MLSELVIRHVRDSFAKNLALLRQVLDLVLQCVDNLFVLCDCQTVFFCCGEFSFLVLRDFILQLCLKGNSFLGKLSDCVFLVLILRFQLRYARLCAVQLRLKSLICVSQFLVYLVGQLLVVYFIDVTGTFLNFRLRLVANFLDLFFVSFPDDCDLVL